MTDFHNLIEYDANITEYTVNSYVLFTPPVGRGDKLLRTISGDEENKLHLYNRESG